MRSALLIGVLVVCTSSVSGEADTRPGARIPPEVAAKAAAGAVAVVVQLRVAQNPAPDEIDQAQDAVLRELSGTAHRVLRRYRSIPFMALEVSRDALAVLATSPHIVRVDEDIQLQRQGPIRD